MLDDVEAVIGENEAYEPLPDELVRLIGAETEGEEKRFSPPRPPRAPRRREPDRLQRREIILSSATATIISTSTLLQTTLAAKPPGWIAQQALAGKISVPIRTMSGQENVF